MSAGGRPRLASVPSETRHCPEHGLVEFRGHRHGLRADGEVRIKWRCMKCHAAQRLAEYHQSKK